MHVLKGSTGSISVEATLTVASECYSEVSDKFVTFGGSICVSVTMTVRCTHTAPYCFYVQYRPKFECKKYKVEEWYINPYTSDATLVRTWYEHHKHWYTGVWEEVPITGCPPSHSNYGRDYP